MKITEYIKSNILYLDGGMGTLLQGAGLQPGELPERWNLTHPDVIRRIHREYYDAGSNVVSTNTFGANTVKFSLAELEKIVHAAVENARAAAGESVGKQKKWVALDVGPTGKMLKPYGELDFEDAVEIFKSTVRLGVKYGVDLVFIETMNDSYETKAALLAAKEESQLPVFVSNAYGEDGKLMTGASPAATVAMLEGLGADAIGMNCSLGPRALREVALEYVKYASVPIILKPNAGLPRSVCGRTVFDVLPEEFAREVQSLVRSGVGIVGGCCGTTPEYIKALCEATASLSAPKIEKKLDTVVSSYTHAVFFDKEPVLIGERINPTGKRLFKEALLSGDMNYILKEGIAEDERGAHILDVNVGLPGINERDVLTRSVTELQAIINLPLQIDTTDVRAMESALRRYNGKAMINSVSGKRESMAGVFPLAKKYGGVVVALTLDDSGIPSTAEGRVAVARKIISEAERFGIEKKNLIFDPLALTVSADSTAARETLRAIRMIREELGCHTLLGVSNVSFGLPHRDAVNSTFFALALGAGLSAAIMNPHSHEMMKTYHAYRALAGLDENCGKYIEFCDTVPVVETKAPEKTASKDTLAPEGELERAIVKGLRDRAAALTREALLSEEPLSVVSEHIIPALNTVGVGFENRTVYLPGLLMSAEAAKASFEVIKENMPVGAPSDKCAVVIATVKGDIHDIGKNIVKLLLENYGFPVYDLGRDVPPERVVDEAARTNADIVALSALMTTTVPAMEETVSAVHSALPDCKVIVGGAVLNREYAERMGADAYAKDAMGAVRYAEEVNGKIKGNK